MKKPSDSLRESARIRSLGQMMAGFIHQFRTPLHVIQSSAAALTESNLPPAVRTHLEMIQRSAERLQGSVQSLLTFAKGDAPPWSEGSINKVINAICDFLQEECKKRSVQLEKHQNAQLPPVRMRMELLEEAMLNLAVNGLEATRKGGILGLQTGLSLDGKWVQVRISDQGKGIDPKVLKRKPSTFVTTKKNGVGLGLFFARQILQQHHAKLEVDSQKGKGTTFTVSFKACKTPPMAAIPAMQPVQPTTIKPPTSGVKSFLITLLKHKT
jgi:signal transduction histidine kinase